MECSANIKSGFWKSLKVPVSLQDKIRAFVLMVCPKMIPAAMKIRKKIYIKISVQKNRCSRINEKN